MWPMEPPPSCGPPEKARARESRTEARRREEGSVPESAKGGSKVFSFAPAKRAGGGSSLPLSLLHPRGEEGAVGTYRDARAALRSKRQPLRRQGCVIRLFPCEQVRERASKVSGRSIKRAQSAERGARETPRAKAAKIDTFSFHPYLLPSPSRLLCAFCCAILWLCAPPP